MPNFIFRLKTLLKLRAAARDGRRSQLAEAYEAERILDERDSDIKGEINDVKKQAAGISQPGPVQIEQLLNAHRYELVLEAQRQLLIQQKQQVTEEIERRQQRLIEADREVRVLEKLREKKWEDYQQEQRFYENKQNDEAASRHKVRED